MNQQETSAHGSAAAILPEIRTTEATPSDLRRRDKPAQPGALRRVGMLLGPTELLVWAALGLLAVAACIAPWITRGWLWFALIGFIAILFVGCDALALWLARKEYAPVLMRPEKDLRGPEGLTMQLPLGFAASGAKSSSEVRVAIMPATQETESALRAVRGPQWLRLVPPNPGDALTLDRAAPTHYWSWTPEIALLRRGVWPGPRVAVERRSRLKIWRLRQWFDLPEPLRIEADLRSGRREILRSPIYRALVASKQTPWTGHGRDFERLREYQPGDTYSEIAWKTTARRGTPVTRLFQWEQKQEVYFVIDQSRASALALDPLRRPESESVAERAPRRLLDLTVEAALVGATVALELGDEFGLVTYADEPKSWLRAGSGQSHFHQFRDRLLNLKPLPTTADYEVLFGEIRLRLRRRAYLVLMGDLTERSLSESLCRGVGLVRSSHAVMVTSILPAHARPAFSPDEKLRTDEDVYAALAGERENQRLNALARQLRRLDVQLRLVPAEMLLRTAVEGYLESKREQRL